MKTIVVTEEPNTWKFLSDEVEIVPAIDYLMNIQAMDRIPFRVLNLCQSYNYQSIGYYTSLLAEACGHKVCPSVLTIQDFEGNAVDAMVNVELSDEIQKTFKHIQSDEFVLSIYFGKNIAKHYDLLCRRLYAVFPMPLFKVCFKHKKDWVIQKIVPLSINDIPETHRGFLEETAKEHLSGKRIYSPRKKTIYFDLAILHNPNDTTSPSNPSAIKRFIHAGREMGISSELIEKEDLRFLCEYDGLFIRETTAVNHHTYRFARRAMAERLVVIDDPVSILKCTNKVYLAELLGKHHIPIPKTDILSKKDWKAKTAHIKFPCVLKQPDSFCSQGVEKVNNLEELSAVIKRFFKTSELVLVQAFVPSEFDWRIGILNHKPLFACRYFMAKDHWQIYNWQSRHHQTGDTDAVALNKLPEDVLHTAVKATKLIGDGLYGVDLKQVGNHIYVIEINDNPSIDHGVEDELEGDALYHEIMQIFLQRMQKQRLGRHI